MAYGVRGTMQFVKFQFYFDVLEIKISSATFATNQSIIQR